MTEAAAWAIYFIPLLGAGFIAAFLRRQPLLAGRLMIGAIGLAWLLALWALNTVMGHEGASAGFAAHDWVSIGNLHVAFGIRLDGLTGVMLVVVTSAAGKGSV